MQNFSQISPPLSASFYSLNSRRIFMELIGRSFQRKEKKHLFDEECFGGAHESLHQGQKWHFIQPNLWYYFIKLIETWRLSNTFNGVLQHRTFSLMPSLCSKWKKNVSFSCAKMLNGLNSKQILLDFLCIYKHFWLIIKSWVCTKISKKM